MPLLRIAPLPALALIASGGSLIVAACGPRGVPDAAPPVVSATPTALATAMPAPVVSAAPSAPPPTGPGTIACGERRCRAGKELCCLGKPARCVPAPVVPDGMTPWEEASVREKACGGEHTFLACDDAGDCAPGQTCCRERYPSETGTTDQIACRPMRDGRVYCPSAELCSADDTRCFRKNNTCVEVRGQSRCELPIALRARPVCGKKPCPAGMTCVDASEGPTCEPGVFRNDIHDRFDVIECNRGRECGEGESCYQNPQRPGRRCDFTIAGIDGLSEPAYCTGVEDCVAHCQHDAAMVPNCHVRAKAQSGACECLTRCSNDDDCRDACGRLATSRQDLDPDANAFCDQRKKACECRNVKRR